ncbi:YcaO-like family protein [Dermabacteraceae bacterium P13115]
MAAEGFSVNTVEVLGDEKSGLRIVKAEGASPYCKSSVQSVGKGAGLQSEASALFELIEHAAALGEFKTPSPILYEKRPQNIIEDTLSRFAIVNSVYRYIPFFQIGSGFELTDKVRLFPAAACDLSLKPETPAELTLSGYRSTNGYAAGSNVRDALIHALNEVIERDATGHHIISATLHKSTLESHPASSVEDESLNLYLSAISEQIKSPLYVSFLSGLAGTTVAVHANVHDATLPTVVGYGSSAYPHYAIERAVAEAQQEHWANTLGLDISEDGGVASNKYIEPYPNLIAARNMTPLGGKMLISDKHPLKLPRTEQDAELKTIDELESKGYLAYGRIAWESKSANVVVCQVVLGGAERFNMIKFGLPIQPVGHRVSVSDVKLMKAKHLAE